MRKWYVLVTVIVVGIAVAAGILFIVAQAPSPDVDTETPSRGFFSFFGRQFGFGDEDPDTTPGITNEAVRPIFRARLALEKMISVSPEIISGITFTASTTATTTIESARFAKRETGHIEDLSLETGLSRRISNTTVPRIQEALFAVNGSAVALRYLADDNETVETFVSPLPTDPNASSTELSGTFFKQNIHSLSWSPTTQELFFITTANTGATGRISNAFGGDTHTVFFSPLKEWLAAWGDPNHVLVTNKPSYLAPGASSRVHTSTGAETVILRGTRGLTTLPSPAGTRVLFSQSDGTATRLFMYDLSSRDLTEFLLPTLPEKCVWADDVRAVCAVPESISGFMPDAWYQGVASFNDSFWMLNGENGQVDFLFKPEDTPAGESVDAMMLSLSYDDTVLAFINKKDLRGWVADLSEWFPL